MNETNMDTIGEGQQIIHQVKFVIFLVLQIPSILTYLLIFLFFFLHKNLLRIRQNQGLLILFIINFIQVTCDIPMIIHYNYFGYVSPSTSSYCTWWTYLEYTLNASGEILMSIISIQRHIFIFKNHLLNNRFYRYLFHDIPIIFSIIYPIILYLILVVLYPCDGTQWDYTSNVCGLANCYLVYSKILGTFDWAVNNGSPMIIIIIANLTLIIRVLKHKGHHHHHIGQNNISWKKQRKMTLQLLSISFIYFIGWFPNLIIGLIQQLFIPMFLIDIQMKFIFDLTYLICLLLPWICLGLFPELIHWIRNIIHRQHRHLINNTIRPTNQLTL